jgi:hypothetical protein|tara:strand:- start:143 stop:373 length:231 start_codon:yes stop_codon:yes gene_type:complete
MDDSEDDALVDIWASFSDESVDALPDQTSASTLGSYFALVANIYDLTPTEFTNTMLVASTAYHRIQQDLKRSGMLH